MNSVIFLDQRFNYQARRRAIVATLAANVCSGGVNVPAYLIQNDAAAPLSKTWLLLSARLSLAGNGYKKLSARQKIA